MRLFIRLIVCVALTVSLWGCTSQKASIERLNQQTECKQQCLKKAYSCGRVCQDNCRGCSRSATKSASVSYNEYKTQLILQGGILSRDLNSYRDALQCRKITCDCSADYNVCVQSCGGRIHKRLQTTKVCS